MPFARFHLARDRRRPLTHGLVLVIVSLIAGYAMVSSGGFPSKSEAFAAPITGLSLPGVGSSIPASDQSVLRPPAINKTLRAEQPISDAQREEATQFAALSASPTATTVLASQEDAVVRAAAVAPEPDLPPYQVYVVQDGDTVSTIAERFGISPDYVTANNAEISNSDFLVVGQTIIIPAGDGILHEVRYGETLSDIATRYDVDLETITSFRSNNIATPDAILETQLVFVPNGRIPEAIPVAPDPLPEETVPPEEAPAEDPDSGSGGTTGGGRSVRSGPSSSAGLMWPLSGPISSYMGPGHPLGIDIDAFNLPGATVVASTSGTVVFAGGNACCSYGLYVVIVSPEGIETLYAHLDSIYVVQGQTVSQGEALGVVGSTGYSTGRHLHFEVIDNGVRVNPLNYLP